MAPLSLIIPALGQGAEVEAQAEVADTPMQLVPGARFTMGTDPDDFDRIAQRFGLSSLRALEPESHQQAVTVNDLLMDSHSVTNAQFARFVRARPAWRRNHLKPQTHNGRYLEHWSDHGPPTDIARQPVTFVTWDAADAYCRWQGKRLPTEAELEWAAQDPRRPQDAFPWGDQMANDELANWSGNGIDEPVDVASYPPNARGLYDMAGNVWHFTSTPWRVGPASAMDETVADPDTGAHPDITNPERRYAVRGGSYGASALNMRVRYRDSHRAFDAREMVGFRCVATLPDATVADFARLAETLVDEHLQRDGLVGVQYAMLEGAVQWIGAAGLADREAGRPMRVHTPINIASISKAVSAWTVLAWAEGTDHELAEPLVALLPDPPIRSTERALGAVTLEGLLSHTAGLSTPSVPVIAADQPIPALRTILDGHHSVPAARLVQAPGKGYRYSGAGYLLLQLVLEHQTGTPFDALARRLVLTPAGMQNSMFKLRDDWLPLTAVYYRANGSRREPYHLAGAAGGLYSNATDMLGFLRLYADEERRARLLSPQAFADLLRGRSTVTDDGEDPGSVEYALGHNTYRTDEGVQVAFHSGSNPGLRSLFIVVPSRSSGLFIAVNHDHGARLLATLMNAWGEHLDLTLHELFD